MVYIGMVSFFINIDSMIYIGDVKSIYFLLLINKVLKEKEFIFFNLWNLYLKNMFLFFYGLKIFLSFGFYFKLCVLDVVYVFVSFSFFICVLGK